MAKTMEDVFAEMGIKPDEKTMAHYGVPGMRWGKRKGKSGSTVSSPKKTVKDMSNDEIKTAIERMKLEQEFVKLATPAPSAGKKAVQTILGNVAKQSAEAYVKKGMSEGGDLIKIAMNNRKK